MSLSSRFSRKLLSLLRFFPPSELDLHTLSKKDRPGVDLTLPQDFQGSDPAIELGRQALNTKDYHLALHHFNKALAKNAQNRWAWHGKGDACQLLGDYKDAYIAYQAASQLDPQCALHFGGLSNALKGMGLIERSEVMKQHALKLDSSLQWMFQ